MATYSQKKELASYEGGAVWVEFGGKIYTAVMIRNPNIIWEIRESSDNGATFVVIFTGNSAWGDVHLFVAGGKLFVSHYINNLNTYVIKERTGGAWVQRQFYNGYVYLENVKQDGGLVYFALTNFFYTAAVIVTFNPTTFAKTTIVTIGAVVITDIEFDATYIYYSVNDPTAGNGTIRRITRVGGVITTIYTMPDDDDPSNIQALCFYEGELYFVGEEDIPATPTTFLLAKWDGGTGRVDIGDLTHPNSSSIWVASRMIVYDGRLIIAYYAAHASLDVRTYLVSYDGTDLTEDTIYPANLLFGQSSFGYFSAFPSELIFGVRSEFITTGLFTPIPPEEIEGSYLFVPMMNSLRWVQRVTPDNCDTFQNFDNTLLCEEVHPYYKTTYYPQKVAKCDIIPQQWNSDFPQHLIELIDVYTGGVVKTFTSEVKLQSIGVSETFNSYITNHGSGKSRVNFYTGPIPMPVVPGDFIEILNNADGFNGTYPIAEVVSDELLGVQYLVISKAYVLAGPSSTASTQFTVDLLPFNVFESVFSFGDVANGEYYARLVAYNDVEGDGEEWQSEPILLDVSHPDTNLIEYRCNDNSYDMVWQTGITCRVRVESWFHNRLPKGKRKVIRNCDGTLIKASAEKYRNIRLETVQLPPYLHEKLSVVFDCDVIRINGVLYQTDEDYSDPKYTTRYQLANSEITLEQVGWFKTQNSHDIGDVDAGETGFIIANEALIKR